MNGKILYVAPAVNRSVSAILASQVDHAILSTEEILFNQRKNEKPDDQHYPEMIYQHKE